MENLINRKKERVWDNHYAELDNTAWRNDIKDLLVCNHTNPCLLEAGQVGKGSKRRYVCKNSVLLQDKLVLIFHADEIKMVGLCHTIFPGSIMDLLMGGGGATLIEVDDCNVSANLLALFLPPWYLGGLGHFLYMKLLKLSVCCTEGRWPWD